MAFVRDFYIVHGSLTVGGGPGTSGLINPVFGQSPCTMTKDGLVRNPLQSQWSEHYNLVALDHVCCIDS